MPVLEECLASGLIQRCVEYVKYQNRSKKFLHHFLNGRKKLALQTPVVFKAGQDNKMAGQDNEMAG
jgi:hypothetical protein